MNIFNLIHIYIYNYVIWFMANVYDMDHILMSSLGSFPPCAWRKDIDTSRPQDFATGLQSHRMSQRSCINIINFKLFERAMMCYVPVPECTCFVMLEMFSNRDMHVELDIFQVFGVARTQHGFAMLRSVWHAFWAAWRRTCHCKSDRHYLIENSRRIHLQQDQQDKKRRAALSLDDTTSDEQCKQKLLYPTHQWLGEKQLYDLYALVDRCSVMLCKSSTVAWTCIDGLLCRSWSGGWHLLNAADWDWFCSPQMSCLSRNICTDKLSNWHGVV